MGYLNLKTLVVILKFEEYRLGWDILMVKVNSLARRQKCNE